jgi:hypothetical protein
VGNHFTPGVAPQPSVAVSLPDGCCRPLPRMIHLVIAIALKRFAL